VRKSQASFLPCCELYSARARASGSALHRVHRHEFAVAPRIFFFNDPPLSLSLSLSHIRLSFVSLRPAEGAHRNSRWYRRAESGFLPITVAFDLPDRGVRLENGRDLLLPSSPSYFTPLSLFLPFSFVFSFLFFFFFFFFFYKFSSFFRAGCETKARPSSPFLRNKGTRVVALLA